MNDQSAKENFWNSRYVQEEKWARRKINNFLSLYSNRRTDSPPVNETQIISKADPLYWENSQNILWKWEMTVSDSTVDNYHFGPYW